MPLSLQLQHRIHGIQRFIILRFHQDEDILHDAARKIPNVRWGTRLLVSDIDSDRMMIRIQGAKGKKCIIRTIVVLRHFWWKVNRNRIGRIF